jgi:hypothetical protein
MDFSISAAEFRAALAPAKAYSYIRRNRVSRAGTLELSRNFQ